MTTAFPSINEKEKVEELIELEEDLPWQVIVSNDPVNLISVVCLLFEKILDLDHDTAMRYTMKVHNEGRCAVYWGSQEDCELKAKQLMSFQLWTHIEKAGK